jgi:hypothetical protein
MGIWIDFGIFDNLELSGSTSLENRDQALGANVHIICDLIRWAMWSKKRRRDAKWTDVHPFTQNGVVIVFPNQVLLMRHTPHGVDTRPWHWLNWCEPIELTEFVEYVHLMWIDWADSSDANWLEAFIWPELIALFQRVEYVHLICPDSMY